MLNKTALPGSRSERGNALFLILIAVALFAALSYAITQSGRGSGSVDKETSMIAAGQVVEYPAGLRTAVTRMVITGTPASGVGGVSLETTGATVNGAAGTATTGQTYQLFDQAGGGATVIVPPPAAVSAGATWIFEDATDPTLGFYVKDVGTNTNVSGREVLAVLPGVTLPVCQQILKGLGVAAFTVPPGVAAGMSYAAGLATYNVAANNTINGVGIDGNPFSCYRDGVNSYFYYHALTEQ